MIVTCANCQTKYNLPDGNIPAGGAKVKCSKCSHVFKVEPPAVATLEDEVESLLEEESQAPDTSAGDAFDDTFDEVAAAERSAAPEPEEEPVDEPEDDLFGESADEPEESATVPHKGGVGAGDDLGDLFDEPFGDDESLAEEPEEAGQTEDDFGGGGVDEPADGEMPGVDDLFDDSDEAEEEVDDADGVAADVESLFGDDEAGAEDDIFADDDEASSGDDDIFASDEESSSGDDIFESEEEEESDVSDLFEEGGDEPEEDELFGGKEAAAETDELFAATADDIDDDDEEDVVHTGKTDFGLDEKPAKEKSGKGVYVLIVLLVLILGLGAAVYFKAWKLVGLDTNSLMNLPVIGKYFMEETGGEEAAAPGESPADRVRKIELQNVKQYYVANEKTGNLFVVEGKAINRFDSPKERIKVEVVLYDASGSMLTTQTFFCGNQLSQFQLQVQTRKEVEDGLASEVGILSNNTFVRPGGSVPFMAVFFEPPAGVAEFLVKVVDVADPK